MRKVCRSDRMLSAGAHQLYLDAGLGGGQSEAAGWSDTVVGTLAAKRRRYTQGAGTYSCCHARRAGLVVAESSWPCEWVSEVHRTASMAAVLAGKDHNQRDRSSSARVARTADLVYTASYAG